MEIQAPVATVRVLINVVNPIGIEGAGTPNDAMNFIAFTKQQFCQVRTVLAGDARD